jgi:hypothetical protein
MSTGASQPEQRHRSKHPKQQYQLNLLINVQRAC